MIYVLYVMNEFSPDSQIKASDKFDAILRYKANVKINMVHSSRLGDVYHNYDLIVCFRDRDVEIIKRNLSIKLPQILIYPAMKVIKGDRN